MDATQIQSLLDAAADSPTAKAVHLPAGDYQLSRPLVIRGAGVKFRGSRDGPTRLFGQFAGHEVVALAERPLPQTFGESLAPGAGAALLLRRGGAGVQRSVNVTTEPGLDLSGLSRFAVSYFFKRTEPSRGDAGVHWEFGGTYGHRSFKPFAVWDRGAGLGVRWAGTFRDTAPGVASEAGKTYHVTAAYGGGRVRLFVGEPGQPAAKVLDAAAPTNPFHGGGVEPLQFGHDSNGPLGDLAAWDGPSAWIDGWHCHTGEVPDSFTCPAAKPTAGPATRFLLNFEADTPFLKGYGGNGRPSYVLPVQTEQHIGGVELSDLTFMGGGASGPCLYDCILSRAERLGIVQAHVGYAWRGTTFASVYRDLIGNAMTYAWLQGGQGMMTNAEQVMVGSAGKGIIFYAAGAVGGSYRGLYLTPHAPCVASLYLAEAQDLNVYAGQVDDEGQAGAVESVVILDRGAWAKLAGVLLTRASPGPLVDLCRGASAHLSGSWLFSQQGGVLLQFRDAQPPGQSVTLSGIKSVAPSGTPLTNRPEWVRSSVATL